MNAFKHVDNYNSSIPRGKFGLKSFYWSVVFILEYAFSLAREVDKDGKLIKRYDSSRWAGRKMLALHNQMVEDLKKRYPVNESTLPLPSIDSKKVDRKFFTAWCKQANMPIVIKGFLKGEKITEATTIESLVRDHGDLEVVSIDPQMNKKDHNRIGQNMEMVSTSLAEYLTLDEHQGNYLNNFYGVLDDSDFYAKSRGADIDEFRKQKSVVSQWFISRKMNSGSTLHCAVGDNMFLNIQGKKEWIFIDPTYMPVLKPALAKYGTYTVSELEEGTMMPEDSYQLLVQDYPYLKHVPCFKYILEPGDILYNPSVWWHSVRNRTDYTVGCAVRYPTKQLDNNSTTLSICTLIISAIKHPKDSFLVQYIKMASGNVESRRHLIHTIFSKSVKKAGKAS